VRRRQFIVLAGGAALWPITGLTQSRPIPTVGSLESANSPSGTPQYPTLLGGYQARPAWKVAGVDYAVGIHPDRYPLKNPATTALPNGTNRSGRTFHVSGANVVVDGWDFTRWNVSVSGSNVMFTNCDFSHGTLTFEISSSAGTVRYCVFDQSGDQPTRSEFVYFGAGRLTAEYNWFKQSFHMHLQLTDGGTGHSQACTFRYNLCENAGWGHQVSTNNHGDLIQFFGSHTITDAQILYNTIIQNIRGAATQGWSITDQNQTYNGGAVNNNTYVLPSPGTVTYMNLFRGDKTNGTFTVKDNYVDLRGIIWGFTTIVGGASNFSISGNINMQTGGTVNNANHG
jgi:hypothetical protein